MAQEYMICDKKGKKVKLPSSSRSIMGQLDEDTLRDEEIVLKECVEARAPAYLFVRAITGFRTAETEKENIELTHAQPEEELFSLTEEEIKEFLAKFSEPTTERQRRLWKRAMEAARDIKPL